jgi:uncharacterized protein (TIGR00159 family)
MSRCQFYDAKELNLFPYFRPQDIIDILIMSFLVYQLYSWFKNSKGLQLVIGLGFLGVLYIVTKNLGLFMTSWVLQQLGTVLMVLLIIIFQTEIRQALYRISLLRNLFDRQEGGDHLHLLDLSHTFFALAAERTGALVVFQRSEPLDDFMLHGIQVDSLVNGQLITSIFTPASPLHDGAILVRGGRIVLASSHLPLSANADLPVRYGTRHRAGLGLTERSDAAVVIVSEERGEVSLAVGGEIQRIDSPELLQEQLQNLLAPPSSQEPVTVTVRERFFSNLWPKVAILVLVITSWLLITSRQGGILTVTAPIKYHNLPDSLALVKSEPEEVEVQLKVFSNLVPSPKQLDVVADIDLSKIKEGVNHLALRNDDFKVPTGVVISGMNRVLVKVTADKKVKKLLPVRVRLVGHLPGNARLRSIITEPEAVEVEGAARIIEPLTTIRTEDLDLSQVKFTGTFLEKRLLPPAPQAKILRDEPVKVKLLTTGR